MEVPGTGMNELALERPAAHVSLDDGLEREFQERLAESATLAFRVAYAVLRHREDAEDVAQEAMAQAYRSFAKLQDRRRFRTWLVRIAWRMALNRRRNDARRACRELAALEPPASPSVEDLLLSREFHAHLWRAVDRLPDRLRSVVLLTAMQGHEVRDVAQMLDVPEGTVKSRLYQARKVLTENLRWLVIGTDRS
jgi:RNA polymerase sigma-70 factor (ECF subfamily)